ncbi:MAG TPA: helicase-related protein, partial [Burkholderiales bacterium]|nr:helicase-related protein [Burkholderiales bacterium]
LANGLLRNPAVIEVARRNVESELVSQRVYSVDQARKRELLTKLVAEGNWQQVLVFMRTKHGANRLAEQLEKSGIEADAIHGNKSQGARTRALNDFKRGAVRVLVATDIAARGIDIQELPHVVNYELPNVPEDYVHRIGRTGRAGSSGEAISLVARDEEPLLRDIERVLKRKMPREVVAGFERGSAPGTPIMIEPSAEARPARSVAGPKEYTPGDHPARKRAPRPRARTGETPAHRRAEGGQRKAPQRPQFAEMRFNNEKREADGNRPARTNGDRAKRLDDNGDVDGNRSDVPQRPQFAAEPRFSTDKRPATGNRPAAARGNGDRSRGPSDRTNGDRTRGAGDRTNGDRAKRFEGNGDGKGEANGNRADAPRNSNNKSAKPQGEVRASAGYPSGLQKSWTPRARKSV